MEKVEFERGAQLSPEHRTYTSVELFLFSAVSWHPHRIHFDQDYTREVEGHEDLLVHGPLQAVHLFDFVRRHLPHTELSNVRYRHLKPLHVGVPAVMNAEIVEVSEDGGTAEVEVWMSKEADDERTTSGRAVLRRVPPIRG